VSDWPAESNEFSFPGSSFLCFPIYNLRRAQLLVFWRFLRSLGDMTVIIHRIFLILLLASAFGSMLCSAEEGIFSVKSNTPDIDVSLRSSDRSLIRLPRLNYEFYVDAMCPGELSPQSMFISIADTRKRLSRAEIVASADTGVTVSVPAKQIAPLTVEAFCVRDDMVGRQQHKPVTVRGALSAQAALLCSGDGDEKMIYTSRVLDITLNCIDERPAQNAGELTAADN